MTEYVVYLFDSKRLDVDDMDESILTLIEDLPTSYAMLALRRFKYAINRGEDNASLMRDMLERSEQQRRKENDVRHRRIDLPDYTKRQQAVGVRTWELEDVTCYARFLHHECALRLQKLMDGGVPLMLFLDVEAYGVIARSKCLPAIQAIDGIGTTFQRLRNPSAAIIALITKKKAQRSV